jgi:hypothetical protein
MEPENRLQKFRGNNSIGKRVVWRASKREIIGSI